MYKAGYSGHDAMRSNAEKMFASEMKDVHRPALTESMSSPARTEMRPFKKGGHAVPRGHHAKHSAPKHHPLTKEQTDLHLPKRMKSKPIKEEKFEKVEHFKKGGHAHKEHHEHKGKKDCYGWGGPVGGMLNSVPLLGGITSMFGMKKGGKVHKKAIGGMTMEETQRGSMESGHDDLRGDKGGVTHWAMRGEEPVKRARGGHTKMEATMHDKKKSGHQNLRGHLGGETHVAMRGEHGKKAKVQHFAIGGVGKIRHDQMSESGKPLHASRKVKHG